MEIAAAPSLCARRRDLGDLIALGLARVRIGRRFDMDRGPLRAQAIGHAFGMTYDRIGARCGIHQDKHALARGPRPFNAMRAHVVDHLSVDPLRGPAQRKLPQGRKIAGGEVIPCGTLGLLGHIDLAFIEAGDQILGRKVDQLDVAGKIDDRIRHGLADSDFGDSGDDVVQAFDMLDVEGRIDVDSGGEQLLDIHVALGMPALRRIGMGKLVDQNEGGPSGQNGVDVHFGEPMALIGDDPARDDFEPLKKRFGLLAAMRLGDADDDIDAFGLFCPRRGQHFIGLADAGRGAEKDL